MRPTLPDSRIERLSALSARRVIDPDEAVVGHLGDGQVVADELLSTYDLDLDLTAEQRLRLASEEIAAIVEEGIRFESILTTGFSLAIEAAEDLTDPWVTYALHEIGEETRHSRLFVRLLAELHPAGRNPFNRGVLGVIKRRTLAFVVKRPPLFYTLVLAGEEIPDLLQKRAAEHPATDPFLAAVNRYHRQEEARHLSFARVRLPQLIQQASRRQRFQVRVLAPFLIQSQYEGLLHPGIYKAVGLSGWRTWRRAHQSAHVLRLRHDATRPILEAALAAGVLPATRIPRSWRRLCGVDRSGRPVSA